MFNWKEKKKITKSRRLVLNYFGPTKEKKKKKEKKKVGDTTKRRWIKVPFGRPISFFLFLMLISGDFQEERVP